MEALLTILALMRAPGVFGQQALEPDFAAQYHVQTDLGDDNGRFFRYQTHTGQYRKEVSLPDGSQEGTYGWIDPNGVLRLFDFIADNQGYRIVKESLYKVGNPNPSSTLATRGGSLDLGFDVYPLDGSVATTRLGEGSSGLAATRLHLPEGALAATNGYTVSSLVSTNQELKPNPLSKQIGATFFSGAPAPPTPKRVVVGAEAAAAPVAPAPRDSYVIGHSAADRRQPPSPPAPARSGIVIGLSNNTPVVQQRRPSPPSQRQQRARPRGIVIGSTRRRRQLFL